MKINTQKIIILLAEQELTKAALSSKCGFRRQNLGTILRRGSCTPKTAGRLAKGLGVSVAEIMKEE